MLAVAWRMLYARGSSWLIVLKPMVWIVSACFVPVEKSVRSWVLCSQEAMRGSGLSVVVADGE